METNLTRRQILLGALGASAVGAVGLTLGSKPWDWLADAAAARPATVIPDGQGTLVLVTLYGGNDGLNTVIPFADSAYLAGRANLGYQPGEVIHLDDALGLHPSLKGLKAAWDAHQLAIVRGVGYPNPNRSHFRSMDIWQSGVPDRAVDTGWLGRWLDTQTADPLQALAVGSSVPLVMAGAKRAASAAPTNGVHLPLGRAFADGFAALGAASGASPFVAYAAARQRDEEALTAALAPLATGRSGSNATGGRRSRVALSDQLAFVAAALKADLPTRVFHVSLAGFDTHANEKDQHARLMGELDDALGTFLGAVNGSTRGAHTTVAVYSEFGRRVKANGSDGTDHGTAGPMFVLGPAVRGGFYGEEPSLTDLDNGDLKFTTDFRSVFSTLMGRTLGTDPTDIFGKRFPDLGFLG